LEEEEGGYINNYFIIDEKTVEIKIFENQRDWKKYIHDYDLNPKFWKRSFSDNWNHLEYIKLMAFLCFPISIPIILFNIYCLSKIFKANDEWRKWLIFSLIVPFIILILNFMGNHPQSI